MYDKTREKFDILASLYSPRNIITSTIDTTTTEGKKFNEIYTELLNAPEFKKFFIDLFKDNNRFNVKFEIGTITNGANANTNTDLPNPTLNLITISPAFLKSANKMEIAKTILHECIHAYLNVKLCDGDQGISISNLNNLDLYNLINEKHNCFNGNQDQ
ncbi:MULTISPECIES: SprT-like domain-containing protein [unclassified Flavobacterium]|uniref:SprT-like domain-containing protein n=1 Tax=unclassified Flavobacterium TaxID=196869 RepID=UPI003F8FCE7C